MKMNGVLLMMGIMDIMDQMTSSIRDLTFANLLHQKAKAAVFIQLLYTLKDAILRHTSVSPLIAVTWQTRGAFVSHSANLVKLLQTAMIALWIGVT